MYSVLSLPYGVQGGWIIQKLILTSWTGEVFVVELTWFTIESVDLYSTTLQLNQRLALPLLRWPNISLECLRMKIEVKANEEE